jgi:parallel beta-helix repeat protein
MGQGGVLMLGDSATQPHHNLIAGNVMRRLGLVYKHVAGVYCVTGSDNRIAHNTISEVPRYGVAMKTFNVTSASHRNLVEFNDIRRTNLETNDTGAIETLGRDHQNTGNIIRYNFILDSVGMGTTHDGKILSPHFAWGIYLDDYSSGTTVEGNIVARTDAGAICVHGGKDNSFVNNIFVDGADHQIRLQPRDEFMRGNRFLRNIVSYSARDSHLIYTWSWSYRRENFAEWDHNLYWLSDGDLDELDVRNTPEGTFTDWRQAGFDAHSLVADPLFADAAGDDYRLKDDSPAWKLGFERIPIEKIGAQGWAD